MTRRLAVRKPPHRRVKRPGRLRGGAGGGPAAPDDVIVTLIPDSGRGYLSKLYNDEWMSDHGFLRTTGRTVGDVLERKQTGLPEFVHAHPEETVAAAIGLLREYNVSQLPVMKEEPPVMADEVTALWWKETSSTRLSPAGRARRTRSAAIVGAAAHGRLRRTGEPRGRGAEKAGAAVVLVDGRPSGLITRQDLLTFLAGTA